MQLLPYDLLHLFCAMQQSQQLPHTLYTLIFIMKILHYVFNAMCRSSAYSVPLDCYSRNFAVQSPYLLGMFGDFIFSIK